MPVAFVQASAEDLPFADQSFDAVLATLVSCTVGDSRRVLLETRRVLRAGGLFRVLEHVRVRNAWIGAAQD